ncbi:hypothetical protein BU26DRAFT_525236 [Trematosphaeria pertusa]|uniref:Uncharacterized protein n=1 Tax=Trematosphaeria pertusa TaxID=390896 RepID=A0A6A6HT98_9PLEO|nr:uncharacterized protein BU26DRAFT_525236 [Trematosphaeria pertusa]KAF2241414.1 hypothetical protein BU26DRAFT_525236 [Trematosphaeria pertusa]
MKNSSTVENPRSNPEQTSRVLTRSWRYWKQLLESATSMKDYPASCFDIGVLLNQTPPIPNNPKIKEEEVSGNLYLKGNAEWDIGGRSGCSLERTTKYSRLQKIPIGSSEPHFCQLSNQASPQRCRRHRDIGNHLALFVLGWSYVLSARLVESFRKSVADHVTYTDSRAAVRASSKEATANSLPIQMGNLTAAELRWWSAILAAGCGWQAILSRSHRQYYPPWSCHLYPEHLFEIIHPEAGHIDCPPPTSNEAQQYLVAFAKSNDAYDQLLAALAASLTLPTHGRFGAPIELPHPKSGFAQRVMDAAKQSTDESHIPHYMALSCIPSIISSTLLGCFWEPGIECDLASEWLYPAQELMQLISEEKRSKVIVKMMALHRPSSAPLWLGAGITGLIPSLLRVAMKHLPSTSLEATIWVRSLQSFMDPRFHRPPPKFNDLEGRTHIYREDEFRLLYITDVESRRYASPPLSPWPPFGTVDITTTNLEVQLHLNCAHRLLYKQWNWQLEDGKALLDPGVPTPMCDSLQKERGLAGQLSSRATRLWNNLRTSQRMVENGAYNRSTSQSATRAIFQWTLVDGIRPDDKKLWTHEWLRDLLEDESGDDDGEIDNEGSE